MQEVLVLGSDDDTQLVDRHALKYSPIRQTQGILFVSPRLWNPDTLAFDPQTASDGSGGEVTVTNTVTVTGPLTDSQLRASPISVSFATPQHAIIDSGTVSISGSVAVTGTFWQATQPVSGTVAVSNFPATQAVTQSGTWTVQQGGAPWSVTISGSVAVTGALTDAQLRATPVPVSGTVTANAGTNLNTSALALESGGNLASIAGKDFATQTTLALIKAKTDNIDVALSTRTKPADQQHVLVDNFPATEAVTQSGVWSVGRTWDLSFAADQVDASGSAVSISGSVAVTGALTDAQLRASPVPITGSVSATSAATATAVPPSYTEGASSALSQNLMGRVRVDSADPLEELLALMRVQVILLRAIHSGIGNLAAGGPQDLRNFTDDPLTMLQ